MRDAGAPSTMIEDARQFIAATSDQVLSAVDHERDAIRRNPARAYAIVNDVVGRRVDIERVSRLVLGKYWRTATRAQRERFKSAFLEKLIRTYVTGISRQVAVVFDGERPEITYLSSTISKDGTEVTVRTRLGGADAPPLRVDYRLQRFGETWQLYDIVVEGVSLVMTYRSSYAAQIKRTGMDGLIERINSEMPGAYRENRVIGRSAADGN
ncbi:MAG: ABC transporter substrate-binding protein [Gammaproteobacteria bacterium]|nr:MAG: ABC transporter substrate-binding protein [Gammaproteobacteria bacterium]